MRVREKVVVVTGGASGIGRAMARRFAQDGARVVVADLDVGGADAVAQEIEGLAIPCDVAREADIQALVARAEATYGPVDLFCSNAGINPGSDPLSTPLDIWQRQWDVNVMAHVHAIRAVLPGMLARGAGYLLHTASMAGILTTHRNLPYAVTKHAVVGLAEWLSVTYHHRGIRVSCLCPLGVRTPMLGDPNSAYAQAAVGPIKEPEQVADMVVEALAEERFLILTDPIAKEWMDRKAQDLERWFRGMRRVQQGLERAES
jgi:NAD(P)-dependent dehydrogenase (short-subunit alcohol dehydrogenase family)